MAKVIFFLLSVPKMLRETIVLTTSDYQTARKYWKVLKGRILTEAGQPVTICYQFKLRAADGKSGVKCRV